MKVQNPPQAFQPGDPTKKRGIPRESDLEGQWDLITRLPQGWGKQTPVLEGTNKILQATTQRKGAVTPQETEPKLPAGVGGSPVEAWVRRGSAQGQWSW